jgi:serine/threonine-protein kinase
MLTLRRIWVHDVRVPGSLVPVTSPELEAYQPAWTRDGERLAFNGAPAGRSGLFWTRPDGTQPPERLSTAGGYQTPASWTQDGQLLYVDERNMDTWLLSRQGDQWSSKALLASQNTEADGQVSPDGRWIAYTSDESGRNEVYVRQFPSLAGRRPVSTEGGREPVWTRNGRELFYLRGSGSTDALEMVVHDVGADGTIAPAGRCSVSARSVRRPTRPRPASMSRPTASGSSSRSFSTRRSVRPRSRSTLSSTGSRS